MLGDFETADGLRRTHPAWRLLAAEHGPLIVSFLYRTFIGPNLRTMGQAELVSRLEDYLFDLRQRDPSAFPKRANEYLDDWAADDKGWLRKYYGSDSDEPQFDLTPATERAVDFVVSLASPRPVSTESRLLTVFELLRQLTEGTSQDAAARIAELQRRRSAIDADIARLEAGHVDLMDAAQIKDRFVQLASTARGLLSDFRELDQSFRDLDREVRERIATWDAGKGALLENVFGARDAISDSDQGRSFRAFWDFLMSPDRQEELTSRLETVLALPDVQALAPDRRLLRIHYDWLEAGEVAQRTVARLSEQLRRYLDDRAFLENRRIIEIIKEIEQHALSVRDEPPSGPFTSIDDAQVGIELPLQRPLFSPPHKPQISARALDLGQSEGDPDALYDQVFVDRALLRAHIRKALQLRSQVSIAEIVASCPLELGLAELIAYLAIAAEDNAAVIDSTRTERVHWVDPTGVMREATLPVVLFVRSQNKVLAR